MASLYQREIEGFRDSGTSSDFGKYDLRAFIAFHRIGCFEMGHGHSTRDSKASTGRGENGWQSTGWFSKTHTPSSQ